MEKTEKVMEKVMENHGIFINLKSTNPVWRRCHDPVILDGLLTKQRFCSRNNSKKNEMQEAS